MSSNDYGVALFVFKEGNIVGVDAGGVKFDGTFTEDVNTKAYSGRVTVKAPPNIEIIQGVNTGQSGLTYEVLFTMPDNFLDVPYIKIDTPFSTV